MTETLGEAMCPAGYMLGASKPSLVPGRVPLAFSNRRLSDHRAYVGDPGAWDVSAASQFNLLTLLGLRAEHHVLDLGCGSLRVGRLLIPYLEPGRYVGLDPDRPLVERGVEREIGWSLARSREAVFVYNDRFDAREVGRRFDFVIAHSIFSHASFRQIETCLARVAEVLAPDGVFLASIVEGEDYRGEAWVYPGNTTFRVETIERAAEGAGLRCTRIDWTHPQTWLYLAREPFDRSRVELPEPARALALERELAFHRRRLDALLSDRGVALLLRGRGAWTGVKAWLRTLAPWTSP